MFVLDEMFNESWKSFLQEQADSECATLVEDLEQERAEAEKAFNIVEDYLNLCKDYYLIESNGAPEGGRSLGNSSNDSAIRAFQDMLKKISDSSYVNPKEANDTEYVPVAGLSLTQDFFSFKFPQNIMFLIGRIVDWIQRVVVHFIAKFKNIINVILGHETKKLTDAEKDIALRFTKTKELEKVIALPKLTGEKTKFATAYQANSGDIVNFRPLGITEAVDQPELEKKISDRQIIISVDISKDLISLEQLLQHFFDLFDNALGSNGEDLFGTDDLKLMLDIFKDTIDSVKNYRTISYEIGGNAVEATPIDARRMHDNLQRTHVNTQNLRNAYTQTSEAIKRVSTVLTQKQLLMATQMGAEFAFLSSATYARMKSILDIIKPRIKTADKLYKNLDKMRDTYGKIANDLSQFTKKIGAFSSMSYVSAYQKKVSNLFDSARYVTQIIGLRMNALAAYIVNLRNVQEMIISINRINRK
jgi:hypothetical protein